MSREETLTSGPIIAKTGYAGSSLRTPNAIDKAYEMLPLGKMRCKYCKSETGEAHTALCIVGLLEEELHGNDPVDRLNEGTD